MRIELELELRQPYADLPNEELQSLIFDTLGDGLGWLLEYLEVGDVQPNRD